MGKNFGQASKIMTPCVGPSVASGVKNPTPNPKFVENPTPRVVLLKSHERGCHAWGNLYSSGNGSVFCIVPVVAVVTVTGFEVVVKIASDAVVCPLI